MRVGLIVNPVAGLGGPAAFRGSDDPAAQRRARERGVMPRAAERATRALAACRRVRERLQIVTWGDAMGEDAAAAAGFAPVVLGHPASPSTQADTRAAAARLAPEIELLLIAGGDGTIRDVLDVLPAALPVLGIPAGVKMRSGVFAVTPEDAGAVIVRLVEGGLVAAELADVQDVDDAVPRSYGELRVPRIGGYVQHLKVGGRESEALVLEEIATWIAERLATQFCEKGSVAAIGPGSTTHAVKSRLGIAGSFDGVDLVRDGKLVARDADAATLEQHIDASSVLIVSFSRGQGFLFGRGNQQLSANVLARIERDDLWIVGSRTKLSSLEGRPLRVDTGDPALDLALRGVVEVVTGYDDVSYHRIG